MGHFDRPRKPRPRIQLPARLKQLDHELMVERSKAFDYLYAVGSDVRIRVCVMRDEDNKCFATAQVGGKALKTGGGYSPSGAFLMLAVAIKVTIAQLTEAERVKVQLENPIQKRPSTNLDPTT